MGRNKRWLQHEYPYHRRRNNNLKNQIINEILASDRSVPKYKLAEGLTYDQAIALENSLIAIIKAVPHGPLVNVIRARVVRRPNRTFSPKHRAALSRAAKRRVAENPDQWNTVRSRAPPTAESIEKNRAAHLARKASAATRAKIAAAGRQRVWTEETKQKISQANRGKKHPFRPRPDTAVLMPRLVWITDDNQNKRVLPELIEPGWRRGRSHYVRTNSHNA